MKGFFKLVKSEVLPVVLPSVITGLTVGIAVFLFKVAAEFAAKFSKVFYAFASKGLWQSAVCLAVITVLSVAAFFIAGKFPFSKGGGIPLAFAIGKFKLKIDAIGTFFATFVSAVITFFVGVPLGTEGPSVSLGALCGYKISKNESKEEIINAAAGAGFCAATGSALGGFLFSIEEMKGKIKAKQITAILFCTLFSYALSSLLCGIFHVHFSLFSKFNFAKFPVSLVFLPILAGVLCSVAAFAFTKFTVKIRKIFKKFRFYKILIIFVLTFFAAVFFSNATGSGQGLISVLFAENPLWFPIVALVVLRCIFLVFSNSAGITGGTFLPLLALGALMGGICFLCCSKIGLAPSGSEIYFILLFMAAFIGAVNKIPFTVTAFLCETFCGFNTLLPLLVATTVSCGLFSLICKQDLNEKIAEELKGCR